MNGASDTTGSDTSQHPGATGAGVSPLLVAIAVVLVVLVVWSSGALSHNDVIGFVPYVAAHALIFCGAVWWVVAKRARRLDLLLILALGLLLRGIAMTSPPALTTDAYRYIWDGRIQVGGVNPYLYVPADERLQRFRDDEIYPNINRKETYPTIYPPAAQIVFLLSQLVGDGVRAIKLVMLGFEFVIVGAILAWLAAEGVPRERVLIYAWHPLPIWEFASQGHLDAAAAAFVMLAIVAAHRGRQVWSGAALAAAGLVKYPALLFAPALWRRWRLAMPLAMLATAALLYAPYVWGAGLKVIGSLFMHLDEEGYRDGYGFYLVGMPRHLGWPYLPSKVFAILAAIALLLLGLRVALRRNEHRVEAGEMILLAGAFFVLISPHYPWYYAVAVPLLCRRVSLGLLFMTLVVMGVYLEQPDGPLEPYSRIKVFTVMFAGAGTLWLAEWWSCRRARRGTSKAE